MAFKIRADEVNLAAATDVSKSTRVRVYNSGGSALLMTLDDSEGTKIGTVTIGAGQVVEIWKNGTETLEGGAALLACPVAAAG